MDKVLNVHVQERGWNDGYGHYDIDKKDNGTLLWSLSLVNLSLVLHQLTLCLISSAFLQKGSAVL